MGAMCVGGSAWLRSHKRCQLQRSWLIKILYIYIPFYFFNCFLLDFLFCFFLHHPGSYSKVCAGRVLYLCLLSKNKTPAVCTRLPEQSHIKLEAFVLFPFVNTVTIKVRIVRSIFSNIICFLVVTIVGIVLKNGKTSSRNGPYVILGIWNYKS